MHYLVTDVARLITLVPGDVILSGTPAFSRPVEPGDVVTVEVEGSARSPTTSWPRPTPVSDEVGAQPTATEEVLSTALGGDWEFRGQRRPEPTERSRPALPARPPEVRIMSDAARQRRRGRRSRRVTSSTTARRRRQRPSRTARRSTGRSKLADVARGSAARSRPRRLGRAWRPSPPGRPSASKRRSDVPAIASPISSTSNVERHRPSSSASTWPCSKTSLRLRVIARGARNFRAYAELAECYQRAPVGVERHRTTPCCACPPGPTVVITPWNAPFMLSTWKCAPALAAGNTVVLKPAEWSPLSCSLLMDLVARGRISSGRLQPRPGIRRRGRRRARE